MVAKKIQRNSTRHRPPRPTTTTGTGTGTGTGAGVDSAADYTITDLWSSGDSGSTCDTSSSSVDSGSCGGGE